MSVTHRAQTLCSAVPLSSLLTGALEATDAYRRRLLPKCQTCAATVNCVRLRPLTLSAITHEPHPPPALLQHLLCCLVTLFEPCPVMSLLWFVVIYNVTGEKYV